jgi:hypothetical protein
MLSWGGGKCPRQTRRAGGRRWPATYIVRSVSACGAAGSGRAGPGALSGSVEIEPEKLVSLEGLLLLGGEWIFIESSIW